MSRISFNKQDINIYDKVIYNDKELYDCIHGYIKISNVARRIIDNKYFQRMRYIKQLGTCYYVFPNTLHSRFEHSIGTYFLTDKLIKVIKDTTSKIDLYNYLIQIPEYNEYRKKKYDNEPLDDFFCELIKIAGLCHDLGHGPFSHVFDHMITNEYNIPEKDHEYRSTLLLKKIITEDEVLNELIGENELNFICSLINPDKDKTGFIYQIVSNTLNGIDVDKFDYIVRDIYYVDSGVNLNSQRFIDDIRIIDNKICYPKQLYVKIYQLFSARYMLHKNIYNHKVVISTQIMIKDIIKLLDDELNIHESISIMNKFCDITDDYILNLIIYIKNFHKEKLSDKMIEADKISKRLTNRELYKFVGEIISNKYIELTVDDFTRHNPELAVKDIEIYTNRIGFSEKSNKIFDNIYFYDRKSYDNIYCYTISPNVNSMIFSDIQKEYIIKVYVKNDNIYSEVLKIFNILNSSFLLQNIEKNE